MTVYADIMRGYARTKRRGGADRWSHLLADDPDELAEFASLLGLHLEGLQSPGTPYEHYNVVEDARRRAVAAGAVSISYPDDTGNVIATKRLQASALDAAARGWHVFSLRPGAKIPAVKDWEQAATVDREQIRRLWTVRLQPDGSRVPVPRNVGIACGPSGLVVIDLDLAKPDEDRSRWPAQGQDTQITSGAEALAALAGSAGQAVPNTYTVTTPSGGQHLYFAAPDGVHRRNSAGRIGPMVDVRGEGGYVVAAGSQLHPPGHEDSATVTGDLDYRTNRNIPPVELPVWLSEATAGSREGEQATARAAGRTRDSTSAPTAGYGVAALRGEVVRVRSAPVGQRNHTLNAAAYRLGQLVASGALDHAQAVEALTDAAAAAGLGTAESVATINSGLSAGAKRPRAIPERRSGPDESSSVGVAPDKSGGAQDEPTRSTRAVHGPNVDHPPPATEPDEIRNRTTTDRRPTNAAADPGERRSGLEYTIDEIDAAHAGWLFGEAWDSSFTGRQPCYPAETLRIACEWEGLPTLGKSAPRFGPRPRAPFIPAPGEELVDSNVYDSWTQAQRDEWYFSRAERADAAATKTRTHREVPDGPSVREAVAASGASGAGAEKATGAERPAPDPHQVLDEAIDQARTAVAHLEATRTAGGHQSRKQASADGAARNDRPAYWAEPEVEL